MSKIDINTKESNKIMIWTLKDEEVKKKEKTEEIRGTAKEIEKILLKENITIGEMNLIFRYIIETQNNLFMSEKVRKAIK